jgi:hypothetical protein
MISKQQVDLAIAAAKDATTPGGDFAWIGRSALMKRAYYCGLFAGLRAVAKEDDLEGFLLRAVVETMFTRSGDDSFSSTSLGKVYEELKKYLLERDKYQLQAEPWDGFSAHLDELERFWNSVLEHARHLLGEIGRIAQTPNVPLGGEVDTNNGQNYEMRDQVYSMLEDLEKSIRILSLIETGHNKWKSFLD